MSFVVLDDQADLHDFFRGAVKLTCNLTLLPSSKDMQSVQAETCSCCQSYFAVMKDVLSITDMHSSINETPAILPRSVHIHALRALRSH
jgi:hypothetical protein